MYFENCENLNELKKEYKKVCIKLHPDMGGDTRAFQDMQAEYKRFFSMLREEQNYKASIPHSKEKHTTEAPEEFMTIINELIKLDGLTIELCGCWLWIGGETRIHKDRLKALGCRWASKKKLWSWHHQEDGSFFYRGKRSMSDIRSIYGSEVYTSSKSRMLTA